MAFDLHHDLVVAGDVAPRAWVLMTHGIFGSGGNWRTIARRLVQRRPEWGCALVDLRMHGRSREAPPPHTVISAARDLAALVAQFAAAGRAVLAVCGHSFGGKVALAHRGLAAPGLLQTWMLDASPSARPAALGDPSASAASVPYILRLLEGMSARFPGRDDFVAQLTGAGVAVGTAQWLAMNLEAAASGDGYALRLDLGAMRALLTDYYQRDLWPALADPTLPGSVVVVAAGRSNALSSEDRTRIEELAAGPMAGRLALHVLPDSGHWLHIDAPDRLLELMAEQLPPA